MFSGVANHVFSSGNPMDESEFGGCQENSSVYIVPSVKFGGGGGLWCGVVLESFMLPTFQEQFGDSPFLFHHDCAPVHKLLNLVESVPRRFEGVIAVKGGQTSD